MHAQGMLSPQQQLAIDAELYNQDQLIMGLPDEMWVHIFSNCRSEVVEEKQLL